MSTEDQCNVHCTNIFKLLSSDSLHMFTLIIPYQDQLRKIYMYV